ncbi:MAG: AAA family ATPase, partial [Candidatus Thiodiazotropha sp.]
MKIKSIRIENFRAFRDETIVMDDYTCFVGPNGSGKSTVLCALNVFFRQYGDAKTDLSKLSDEDFHHKNTAEPIKITVTFTELSEQAKNDLSDYVRQDKLIVSSVAEFSTSTGRAEVKQYGNRLVLNDFRPFFEADKNGAKVAELKSIFDELKSKYTDLPDAKTKGDMISVLQEYEASHSEDCVLAQSEDQFYGVSKGANRLAPHVQWVFLPAVKDATMESEESKNSALGQLLARTVRSRVNFSERIGKLRDQLSKDYQAILDAEKNVLDDLSKALDERLKSWAHPKTQAQVLWKQDPEKSVKVDEPWAFIKLGESGFEGELPRFGHGLQRSYVLALLHELALLSENEKDDIPTLILGIEEPELFQHPPQAKHLASVLQDLSSKNSQIILCTHSPYFVTGDKFEQVRMVRGEGNPSVSSVSHMPYEELAKLTSDEGKKPLTEEGVMAKIHQALTPVLNEIFFTKCLILVEGVEDIAYLTTYLILSEKMSEFRQYGCHIVPVNGKSEIPRPLAIARHMGIPTFVICDCDTDKPAENGQLEKHRK